MSSSRHIAVLSILIFTLSTPVSYGLQREYDIPDVRLCAPAGGEPSPDLRVGFAKGVSREFVNLGMVTNISLISAAAEGYHIVVRKPDGSNATADYRFDEPGVMVRLFGSDDVDFQSKIDQPGMYIVTVEIEVEEEGEHHHEPRGHVAFYAVDGLSVRPHVLSLDGSEAGSFSRGETVVIETDVYYPTTEERLTPSAEGATVTVISPDGEPIIAEFNIGKSTWTAEYKLKWDASLVNWSPEVIAKDFAGNSGSSLYPYTIQIQHASFDVKQTVLDDSSGMELSTFKAGSNIRIELDISYPDEETLSRATGGSVLGRIGWGHYDKVRGEFGGDSLGGEIAELEFEYDEGRQVWLGRYTVKDTDPVGSYTADGREFPYNYSLVLDISDGADQPNTQTLIRPLVEPPQFLTITSVTTTISTVTSVVTSISEVIVEVVPSYAYLLAGIGAVAIVSALMIMRRRSR